MSTDAQIIIKSREGTHGNFRQTARTANLVRDALLAHGLIAMAPVQQESLNMIATKLARIVCGNPDCAEHWLDIQGYCELVLEDIAHEEQMRKQSGAERSIGV